MVIGGDFNCLSFAPRDASIAPPDAYFEMARQQGPLSFRSSYRDICGAEPPYTSVKPAFAHTIDYIFYTRHSLTPTAVLEVVRHALPSVPWPSDHLPLLTRFEFNQLPAPTKSARLCAYGDSCIFFAKGCCKHQHPPRAVLRELLREHPNTPPPPDL